MLNEKQNLPAFTAQTNDHEIDLAFQLVMELWKPYFPWLNCNFDVIKPERNLRPDFIFHRLGVHIHNTLIVEVKRKSHNEVSKATMRCKNDEDKIHDDWFIPNLSYQYGASVVIDEKTFEFAFALFQNNPAGEKRFRSVNYQQIGFPDDTGIIPVIKQFIAAKAANINANTSNLEQQIEALIQQLYPQEYQ